MKKLPLLGSIALLLCACHSITITNKDGSVAKVSSFGQKVSIGGAQWGDFSLTNYNLDQVSGIQAISAAINSGIAAGAANGATGGLMSPKPGNRDQLYRLVPAN